MRQTINRIAVFGLLAFVCVLPGMSQTGTQSLAETTQWLQWNVGGISCAAFSMGKSQADLKQYLEGTEATFADCQMTLDTSTTIDGEGDMGSYRVHLGKLDPSRIMITEGVKVPAGWVTQGEVPQAGIRLITVGEEKVIDATTQRQDADPGQASNFKTAEINIRIRNGESAGPMLEAFSRAITMCKP